MLMLQKGVLMKTAAEWKEEGNAFFGQAKYREAMTAYQEALQIAPVLSAATHNLALCHKKMGDIDKAIAIFHELITNDPTYIKAINNLADCYIQQNNFKDALTWIEKSRQITKTALTEKMRNHCLDKIAAKLLFGIIDLKLTSNNQIKILEFGRGMESGAKGVEQVYGKSILSILQEKLIDEKIKIPFFSTSQFTGDVSEISDNEQIDDFINQGHAILSDNFSPELLHSYAAIYGGSTIKSMPPNILVLDDNQVFNLICGEKILLHHFMETEHAALRPKAKIFPRQYHTDLQSVIRENFAKNKLVIKASDMQRGEGIIITNQNDKSFEQLLSFILCSQSHSNAIEQSAEEYTRKKIKEMQNKRQPINYQEFIDEMSKLALWISGHAPLFMIEEYTPSKNIRVDNATYDPTMRVHFILYRDNGAIKFIPLTAYWKLPTHAVNQGNIRQRSMSHVTDDSKSVHAVSQNDQDIVFNILNQAMPALFQKILDTKITDIVAEFQNNVNPFFSTYSYHLMLKLANAYGSFNQNELGLSIINNMMKNLPDERYFPYKILYKLHHEKAMLLHRQGKYKDAIANFNKAIEIEPVAGSYYRRGLVYETVGQYQKALADFNKALEIAPSMTYYNLARDRVNQKILQYNPNPGSIHGSFFGRDSIPSDEEPKVLQQNFIP